MYRCCKIHHIQTSSKTTWQGGIHELDQNIIALSLHIDSCTCEACGARWDEDIETGRYRGRGSIESVIVPRQH